MASLSELKEIIIITRLREVSRFPVIMDGFLSSIEAGWILSARFSARAQLLFCLFELPGIPRGIHAMSAASKTVFVRKMSDIMGSITGIGGFERAANANWS